MKTGIALLMAAFVLANVSSAYAAKLANLDPAKSYRTASIDFSGNRVLSDDDIEAVMQTKTRVFYKIWQARPAFEPYIFSADLDRIKRLYEIHGYYGVHVDYGLDVKGNLVAVHIEVSEGEPVKVGSIQVRTADNKPTPRQIDKSIRLPLKVGAVFDQGAYQLSQQQLVNAYMQNGYAHVKVDRRAEVLLGHHLANIWYTVEPGDYGVFDGTSVVGLKDVSPNIVTRELTYKPGEEFDSRKIANSREKIVALNLFSTVEFVPELDAADPHVVPIQLKVHERPKHDVNFMLGYNTESQFNVGLMWNDWNFFGGGRQATLAATYSDVVSSLDAKLTQPYFLAPESTFIVEAIQEQSVYQTYTLNASRFYPREVYHFTPHLVGSFGWRLEYLKFNSLSVSTINAIGGVRRDGILSGPSMALTYNTVENPLNPQRGEVLSLRSDVAERMFGSAYSFWRTLFEARKYIPIGWHTVFASRFRLGFADSFGPIRDLPWSERFYSGGEGSVRGYGLRRIGPLSRSNDPLGGRSLVEGSMELRRPLFWKLNGAAFFDCGQVSIRSFRVPVTTLQCGYGPAVSVDTPVGAMRVDLGFPTRTPRGDSSWQVYFSIGQYF